MMNDDKSFPRAHPRKKKILDLTKHLITAIERRPIRCLAVDVSRNGIGLVSFDSLTEGSEVILVLKEKGILLKVKWCKPDSLRQDVFHAGVESSDLSVSLIKLLENEGLMDATDPEPEAVPPATKAKSLQVTFETIRDLLAIARTTDPGVLRQSKLAKFSTTHNAFPLNFQGNSLCVLLPKELKPKEASTFDDAEANSRKIFVFKTAQNTLTMIWPKEQ